MFGPARFRGVLFLLLLGALPAAAWPVEGRFDLEVGEERFWRLARVDGVEVLDPSVADVERLEGGELFVTAKTVGRTLVRLSSEGKAVVWWVRVAPKGGAVQTRAGEGASLHTVCTEVEETPESLLVTVPNEACRKALLGVLQTDRYLAREVAVTFSVEALQAQLAALEKALQAEGLWGLTLRYEGAGLLLEGKLEPRAHARALWVVFENTVGRLSLDDRVEHETSSFDSAPKSKDEETQTP